ncbi:hypothetical protein R0J90_19710, partial [Micrococcus sp. SIMBA_144]
GGGLRVGPGRLGSGEKHRRRPVPADDRMDQAGDNPGNAMWLVSCGEAGTARSVRLQHDTS